MLTVKDGPGFYRGQFFAPLFAKNKGGKKLHMRRVKGVPL